MSKVRQTKWRNFFIALTIVVVFGYSLGKDAAKKENLKDQTIQPLPAGQL